jgi:hypothetical protein
MKIISFLVRITLVGGGLLFALGSWQLHFLAYIPQITDQRHAQGLGGNLWAGFLLDFVFSWQDNYYFWNWVAVLAVTAISVFTWGKGANGPERAKLVFILYMGLLGSGTASLMIATAILRIN